MLGVESAGTECSDSVLVYHGLEVVVVPNFDLLDLIIQVENVLRQFIYFIYFFGNLCIDIFLIRFESGINRLGTAEEQARFLDDHVLCG